MGSDQVCLPLLPTHIKEFQAPTAQSPVHWLFFFGPVLVATNHCISETPNKTCCCFGDPPVFMFAYFSTHHLKSLTVHLSQNPSTFRSSEVIGYVTDKQFHGQEGVAYRYCHKDFLPSVVPDLLKKPNTADRFEAGKHDQLLGWGRWSRVFFQHRCQALSVVIW